MITDCNYAYNCKSLCCTSETNIILYIKYFNKNKF